MTQSTQGARYTVLGAGICSLMLVLGVARFAYTPLLPAQILGPAVTGSLAAHLGSYAAGLYFAAAIMLVGTALLLVLKTVERHD